MGRTSGLLVKALACNQKVAGSSPTRYRLFFPYEYTQMYPQNEEMFITTSFRGDVKLPVPGSWLILATYSSFLVKLHLVKPLVEKKCTYMYCNVRTIRHSFKIQYFSSTLISLSKIQKTPLYSTYHIWRRPIKTKLLMLVRL